MNVCGYNRKLKCTCIVTTNVAAVTLVARVASREREGKGEGALLPLCLAVGE